MKTVLRRAVSNIKLPNLDLGINYFSSSFSGPIKDAQIDSFMDEVDNYLSNIKNIYSKACEEYILNMDNSAKQGKMSESILSKLKEELESQEKDLKTKESTLETLRKCLSELEKAG